MTKTTVNCKYKFCKHESRELKREDAILTGRSTYYHKDCYENKENIKEIVDLFSKNINKDVVYAQLQKVIKTIVFEKGISSDFLLFGLKYYISHKIQLNYPQGLYYVVQNKDVKAEYEKIRANKIRKEMREVVPDIDNAPSFTFVPTQQSSFLDILK